MAASKSKVVISLLEVVVLLALLGGAFVVVSLLQRNKPEPIPFCDPATPRAGAQESWDEIYGTGATTGPATVWAPVRDLWKQATVTTESGRLVYTYPYSADLERKSPPDSRTTLAVNERFESDGGSLEIIVLGTGWVTAETASSETIKMAHFAPDLASTHSAIVKPFRGLISEREYRGNFDRGPRVQVGFRVVGLDNVKYAGFNIFDARTRQRVIGGSGSSWHDDGLRGYGADLKMWHAGPVDIMVDIAYGPAEVSEFPAVVGEGYSGEGADIRLAVIARNARASTRSNAVKKTLTVTVGSPITDPNRMSDEYVFFCQPLLPSSRFDLELLDADGKKVSGGSSSGGFHLALRRNHDSPEVDRIRLTRRPHLQRVFFRLPYWPGLPEANRDIRNLMELNIPYVEFKDQWGLDRMIRESLQCLPHTRPSGTKVPADYFPRTFVNATAHEILKDYGAAINTPFTVKGESIVYETPPPSGLLYELKKLWDKLF